MVSIRQLLDSEGLERIRSKLKCSNLSCFQRDVL